MGAGTLFPGRSQQLGARRTSPRSRRWQSLRREGRAAEIEPLELGFDSAAISGSVRAQRQPGVWLLPLAARTARGRRGRRADDVSPRHSRPPPWRRAARRVGMAARHRPQRLPDPARGLRAQKAAGGGLRPARPGERRAGGRGCPGRADGARGGACPAPRAPAARRAAPRLARAVVRRGRRGAWGQPRGRRDADLPRPPGSRRPPRRGAPRSRASGLPRSAISARSSRPSRRFSAVARSPSRSQRSSRSCQAPASRSRRRTSCPRAAPSVVARLLLLLRRLPATPAAPASSAPAGDQAPTVATNRTVAPSATAGHGQTPTSTGAALQPAGTAPQPGSAALAVEPAQPGSSRGLPGPAGRRQSRQRRQRSWRRSLR